MSSSSFGQPASDPEFSMERIEEIELQVFSEFQSLQQINAQYEEDRFRSKNWLGVGLGTVAMGGAIYWAAEQPWIDEVAQGVGLGVLAGGLTATITAGVYKVRSLFHKKDAKLVNLLKNNQQTNAS